MSSSPNWLAKVRQIEIAARRHVDELLSGDFKTRFRGHGVQFSEHRTYVPGDDVRHIDWKVSARTKEPLIKKFEEERELQVLILADVSQSGRFGTHPAESRKSVVAQAAAMIAYAAGFAGDRFGLLSFGGAQVHGLPMGRGKKHLMRLVGDILSDTQELGNGKTYLVPALQAAGRLLKQKGVIFVISDFQVSDTETALMKEMRGLCRKHDIVLVRSTDSKELELPRGVGRIRLWNPETGETAWRNSEDSAEDKVGDRLKKFIALGAEYWTLTVADSDQIADQLIEFFRRRKRRGNRLGN